MAFDINQFRSSFRDFEPASPTNYEVSIYKRPSVGWKFQNQSIERDLIYRCESCGLPSRDLIVSNRMTYGAPNKVVSGGVYNNLSFTFIVSDSMREKNYFYEWQKYILNHNIYEEDNPFINDVAYLEDYVGAITISTFSKFGDLTYQVVLQNAYPISVNEVPLGWNNTNDYVRVTVTIAYKSFYEVKKDIKGINSQQQKDIIQFDANRVNLNKARVGSPFLR